MSEIQNSKNLTNLHVFQSDKLSHEAPTIRTNDPIFSKISQNIRTKRKADRFGEWNEVPTNSAKIDKRGVGIVDRNAFDQVRGEKSLKETVSQSQSDVAKEIVKNTNLYSHRTHQEKNRIESQIIPLYEGGRNVHREDIKEKFGAAGGYINGNGQVNRENIGNLYEEYKKTTQADVSAREIRGELEKISLDFGKKPQDLKDPPQTFNNAELALTDFANQHCGTISTKGLYSPEERASIGKYVIHDTLKYCQQAGIPADKAYCLVRDNLIKIHYQQMIDHKMITGSDHGVRHVVQSNIANTLKVLEGMNMDPKSKLMATQVMINHDLGYTLDAAKGSFDASKDHPLASTAFVDLNLKQNPTYGIFSNEELGQMQNAVLKHSYPFAQENPLTNNWESIEKVISIVDAMGVTADTKMPAIFREEKCQEVLRALVSGDLTETQAKDDINSFIENSVRIGTLSQEIAEGYKQAVELDMSKFGAKMILPQNAGRLAHVGVKELDKDQFAMTATFDIVDSSVEKFSEINQFNPLNAFSKLGSDINFYSPGASKSDAGLIGKTAEAVLADGKERTLKTGPYNLYAMEITLKKVGA